MTKSETIRLFKTLEAIEARLSGLEGKVERVEAKIDGLIAHLGAGDEVKNLDTVREAVGGA